MPTATTRMAPVATGCQKAETPYRFRALETTPSKKTPTIVPPIPPRPPPSEAPPTITAVIVGGASLEGGRGGMGGTIVGVFLLGVVSNALNLYGVSAFWQPVATGAILVVAVGIDSYSARNVVAGR